MLAGKRVAVHFHGTVLITGAASGIGRHAAMVLASKGYLVLACVRRPEDAENLKKACPSLEPVILDVTSQESVDACMEIVRARLADLNEPLVGLVNNAGVGAFFPAEAADMELAEAVMSVNVLGVLRMYGACLPLLKAAGPGARIINISSAAGFLAGPGFSAYSASKHALQAISDATRVELSKFGMWVCTVNPGAIKTPIVDKPTMLESLARVPEELKGTYSDLYRINSELEASIRAGSSPEVTSAAILHGLTSPRPWTRYLVANLGADKVPTWLAVWLRWYLPAQWLDWAVLFEMQRRRWAAPAASTARRPDLLLPLG